MTAAIWHLAQGDRQAQWEARQIGHRKTAHLHCPDCGTGVDLLSYSIEFDGTVQPAFECRACDFHERLVLTGWEP